MSKKFKNNKPINKDDIKDLFVQATTAMSDTDSNAWLVTVGIYDILLGVIKDYMKENNISNKELRTALNYTKRGYRKLFKSKKINLIDIIFIESGLDKIAGKKELSHTLSLQCRFRLQLTS